MCNAWGRRLAPSRRLAAAIVAVALWHAPGVSLADDVLTSQALVADVLAANPKLAALEAAVAEARARVEAAGSLDDAMLSYLGAPESGGSRIGDRHVVMLSQAVPWPGTLALRADAASAEARAAALRTDAWRLELAETARALFAEWYYLGHALRINAGTRSLLDELIDVARTRYAAGRARQQDVLLAETERAMLRRERYALQRQQRQLRAQINALLNRPPDTALAAAGPLADSLEPPVAPAATHPDLEQLDAAIAASTQRIALARKAFFPDLRFTAQWNSLWDAEEKRWNAGIALNLPLARDRRRADLDAAQAARVRLQWQRSDRAARLAAQREAARAAVAEAGQAVVLHVGELLPLARETLAAARSDYRAGAGPFLNVITAEQRLLRTEHALARAQADRFRAQARLRRWSAGETLEDSMP